MALASADHEHGDLRAPHDLRPGRSEEPLERVAAMGSDDDDISPEIASHLQDVVVDVVTLDHMGLRTSAGSPDALDDRPADRLLPPVRNSPLLGLMLSQYIIHVMSFQMTQI